MTTVKAQKNIKRETEKAVLASFFGIWGGGIEKEVDVWLPKSQIKIDSQCLEIPTWLLDAKENDLSNPHASFRFLRAQFN